MPSATSTTNKAARTASPRCTAAADTTNGADALGALRREDNAARSVDSDNRSHLGKLRPSSLTTTIEA
jgi:hypothetical protein